MPKRVSDRPPAYLGIDPGVSGGLAILWSDGRVPVTVAMPGTERDLWDWLSAGPRRCFAVIEQVGGFMGSEGDGAGDSGEGKQKKNLASGHTMFTFGANFGALKMALTAAGIPFEVVPPRRWQKALSIPPKKASESKTAWKNRLKARAQQLYPGVPVTLKTADALLLATYCQRMREGHHAAAAGD